MNAPDITTKGYTLIEILIATFIFSIMVMLVSLALNQYFMNKKLLEEKADILIKGQLAFSIIDNDFKQVVNWKRTVRQDESGSFYTKSGKLHFAKMGYINPDFQLKQSTLQKVEYQLNDNKLIRITLDVNDQVKSRRILLENVTKMQWQFYDLNLKQYTLWPPVQQIRDQLPYGVRITVWHSQLGKITRIYPIYSKEIEFNETEKNAQLSSK